MNKILSFLKKIYKDYKLGLFGSLVFTFLNHIYFFTSHYANEDDINFISFNGRTLTSGRWTTGGFFTGQVQVPIVKFVFVLIVFAIISVLILDLFKIKKTSNKLIIPMLLSTFPSLAMSFGYMFMIEIYCMSLLLAVLSVYFTAKFEKGYLIGGVLLAFSLGNYQSYIAFASGLSILYLIKITLEEIDKKELLSKIVKFLLMGIIGVILYFIILKILLLAFNTSLSSYKGADSMGIPPFKLWPKLFLRTYLHFFGYFGGFTFFKSSIFYIIIRFLLALAVVFCIFKNKFKHKEYLLYLLILLILAPFAINIVDFFAYKADLSVSNMYQYVLAYILIIIVFENCSFKNDYLCCFYVICLLLVCYQNFILTNRYYIKNEEFYDYTINLTERLLVRMENTEGFYYGMSIMIVGNKDSQIYENLFNVSDWNDIVYYDQGLWGRFIGFQDIYDTNEKKLVDLINNYFGFKFEIVDSKQRNNIQLSDEFNEMTIWPDMYCMQVIDGVLVIKI